MRWPATLSTARTETGALLTLSVRDGFHVYGTRETIGRPRGAGPLSRDGQRFPIA